jgi:Na+/phosphate symporter
MTRDRNYLRMMHDCELTRYAADNVRTELEFVLLERLERLIDVEDELEAARQLNDELSASRDNWIEENVALQTENDRLRDLVS